MAGHFPLAMLLASILPLAGGYQSGTLGLRRIQQQALRRCTLRTQSRESRCISMQGSDESTIPGTWCLTTMIEVPRAHLTVSNF